MSSTQTSLLVHDVTADSHISHPLHGPGTTWPETNCALDLWIELLALTGREPSAAGAVAFAADFVGDHWVMLEFAREDLRRLYGVDVVEFGPWKPTVEHLVDHLPQGRLLTMESDAMWLPDALGTDYHTAHTKTGIVPLRIDVEAKTMGYLHNAGFYELGPEDFDGAMGLAGSVSPQPYLEMIRFLEPPTDLRAVALGRLATHLSRRPETNPVTRLGSYLFDCTPALHEGGMKVFHQLAFATVRQLGASAQLAAGFLGWLGVGELAQARSDLNEVAQAATRAQFNLARVARGRSSVKATLLSEAAEKWESAVNTVAAWSQSTGHDSADPSTGQSANVRR